MGEEHNFRDHYEFQVTVVKSEFLPLCALAYIRSVLSLLGTMIAKLNPVQHRTNLLTTLDEFSFVKRRYFSCKFAGFCCAPKL